MGEGDVDGAVGLGLKAAARRGQGGAVGAEDLCGAGRGEIGLGTRDVELLQVDRTGAEGGADGLAACEIEALHLEREGVDDERT